VRGGANVGRPIRLDRVRDGYQLPARRGFGRRTELRYPDQTIRLTWQSGNQVNVQFEGMVPKAARYSTSEGETDWVFEGKTYCSSRTGGARSRSSRNSVTDATDSPSGSIVQQRSIRGFQAIFSVRAMDSRTMPSME
jgi:hypothetical protein